MNSDKTDDPGDDSQKRFFMAPDHLGHWVVQDQSCRRSGYFINREWARKYALSENGHRTDLIVELSQASALNLPAGCIPRRQYVGRCGAHLQKGRLTCSH